MAVDKGEVFLFQKITSVWLTGNRRDKEFALDKGFNGGKMMNRSNDKNLKRAIPGPDLPVHDG